MGLDLQKCQQQKNLSIQPFFEWEKSLGKILPDVNTPVILSLTNLRIICYF